MNNSDLISKIFAEVDFKNLAVRLSEEILADDKFLKELKTRMLERFTTSQYEHKSSLEGLIIRDLAEEFIKNHAQEILAKIDLNAIVNGIALKSMFQMGEKMKNGF